MLGVKTNPVRAVYNNIFKHFETCSFVENVREESKVHGLKTLQKKKVLILDDVDKNSQFKTLAGNLHWFGKESRIIMTTEDKQHLRKYFINYAQGLPLALEVLGSDLYIRTNDIACFEFRFVYSWKVLGIC